MDSMLQQLASGQLTLATAVIWLLVVALLSVAGGAATGVALAGKDLGNDLAAMMGGMFGPTAAVPAAAVGLFVLHLL